MKHYDIVYITDKGFKLNHKVVAVDARDSIETALNELPDANRIISAKPSDVQNEN